MIVFLLSASHIYTFKNVVNGYPGLDVRLLPYENLWTPERLREGTNLALDRATYIFTDLDRLPSETLRHASALYRQLRALGLTVLNDPARFLSRSGLLRQLYRAGLNSFDVHRVEYGERPTRWPVFLRTEGDHLPPLQELYENLPALEEGIAKAVDAGLPLSRLLIVEFAAEPVKPGVYRKLALFRVGPTRFAHTNVFSTHWVAKDGTPGAADDALFQEELGIVRDNPFETALDNAFDIAGLDYGRADFGIVDGRVQVYEINPNPMVGWNETKPNPNPVRLESLALFKRNYLAALAAIDTR